MEPVLQIAKVVELRKSDSGTLPREKEINQKRLINKINFINFQDGNLFVNLRHTRFDRTISLQAKPHPCLGEHLECTWVQPGNIARILQSHTFEDILIPDQLTPWRATPQVLSINEEGITLQLPAPCKEVCTRRVRRQECNNIAVEVIQNSAIFHGRLADFSPVSFRAEIHLKPPQNFYWINPNLPVQVHFRRDDDLLFAGECRIIKQNTAQKTRTLVLQPVHSAVPRHPKKEFRSPRLKLTPSPNIFFHHPVTHQRIDLKVLNLSGTGFMVEEEQDHATLLPGMIIPELELNFAGIFQVSLKAQVVYCKPPEEGSSDTSVRCGFVILDMAVEDHVMLLALLNQTKDANSYMCNRVDMDQLFQFFFETGFIYPEKYSHINSNKKNFRDTYQKLYTQAPGLARHFIYQDNLGIQGHMSMLRFYENTWMAHHHAAKHLGKVKNAGLHVLEQANNFINESHTLSSVHLNFILCYFRPENRFPNRVFGGSAKYIDDNKGCSVDSFAYLHTKFQKQNKPSSEWSISEVTTDDLKELEHYYETHSGGLMITALDLEPELVNQDTVSAEYKALSLYKKRVLYAVKNNNQLKSFIMVNMSDPCLNMSDLTNCLKAIVIDSTDLTKDIFFWAINSIMGKLNLIEATALVYPKEFVEKVEIDFEKTYNMFILNMQYLDKYFEFIQKINIK